MYCPGAQRRGGPAEPLRCGGRCFGRGTRRSRSSDRAEGGWVGVLASASGSCRRRVFPQAERANPLRSFEGITAQVNGSSAVRNGAALRRGGSPAGAAGGEPRGGRHTARPGAAEPRPEAAARTGAVPGPAPALRMRWGAAPLLEGRAPPTPATPRAFRCYGAARRAVKRAALPAGAEGGPGASCEGARRPWVPAPPPAGPSPGPWHSAARRPPPAGCSRSEWGRAPLPPSRPGLGAPWEGWGEEGPGLPQRSPVSRGSPGRGAALAGPARPGPALGPGQRGSGGPRSLEPPRPPQPPRGAALAQPAGQRRLAASASPPGALAWALRALVKKKKKVS